MAGELLIEHFENPRHVGEVTGPDGSGRAENPVCGDEVRVSVRVEEGRVGELRFRARGCHATIASMSLLCDRARGLAVDRARRIAPEELMGWFDGFPAGKRHAAEVSVEALRQALSEAAR